MAYKKTVEVSNGAPETPQIPTTDTPPTTTATTTPDSLPGSETLDPQNDGSYEQFREQRIKENLARMQKLGIVDLSLKFKSSSAAAAKRAPRSFNSDRKTPIRDPSLLAPEPRRRSSRLQSVTPVSYEEAKPEGKVKKDWILMDEGSKPEFYTEEQEKLLGSTEMEWTLFVDGVGPDGKRIYDPIKGKTCHQCRQKTLGHRTHCCKCQIVQGQFCGDCLYMRYGEHVLEAQKNPDWVCPPCRGICNCSLCRQAKGWAPTGAMYKKIARLEYKSVAHFLIQTRRAPPATQPEEVVVKTPHSAKRSLAFTDVEVPEDGKEPCKKANIGGQKLDYGEKENGCQTNDISILNVGREKTGESKDEQGEENSDISMLHVEDNGTGKSADVKDEQDDRGKSEVSMLNVGDKGTGENKDDCKENVQPELETENGHQMEDETSPDQAKKIVSSCGPKTDSIARRTRSRHTEENKDASKAATVEKDEAGGIDVISDNTPSAIKAATVEKDEAGGIDVISDNTPSATKKSQGKKRLYSALQDSIARRLRSRISID